MRCTDFEDAYHRRTAPGCPPDLDDAMRRHLGECAACHRLVTEDRHVNELLSQAFDPGEGRAVSEFTRRVMASLPGQDPPRSLVPKVGLGIAATAAAAVVLFLVLGNPSDLVDEPGADTSESSPIGAVERTGRHDSAPVSTNTTPVDRKGRSRRPDDWVRKFRDASIEIQGAMAENAVGSLTVDSLGDSGPELQAIDELGYAAYLELLGLERNPDDLDTFLVALSESSERIGISALDALSRLRATGEIDRIVNAILELHNRDGVSDDLHLAAVRALSRLPSDSGVSPGLAVFFDDFLRSAPPDNTKSRRFATEGLLAHGGLAYRRRLLDLLDDPDSGIRMHAARILEILPHPDVSAWLEPRLTAEFLQSVRGLETKDPAYDWLGSLLYRYSRLPEARDIEPLSLLFEAVTDARGLAPDRAAMVLPAYVRTSPRELALNLVDEALSGRKEGPDRGAIAALDFCIRARPDDEQAVGILTRFLEAGGVGTEQLRAASRALAAASPSALARFQNRLRPVLRGFLDDDRLLRDASHCLILFRDVEACDRLAERWRGQETRPADHTLLAAAATMSKALGRNEDVVVELLDSLDEIPAVELPFLFSVSEWLDDDAFVANILERVGRTEPGDASYRLLMEYVFAHQPDARLPDPDLESDDFIRITLRLARCIAHPEDVTLLTLVLEDLERHPSVLALIAEFSERTEEDVLDELSWIRDRGFDIDRSFLSKAHTILARAQRDGSPTTAGITDRFAPIRRLSNAWTSLLDRLGELFDDSSPSVRREVIETARHLVASDRRDALLRQGLEDENLEVRQLARAALASRE